MKTKLQIAILLLLSSFLTNCSGKKVDYGEVKDGVYSNAFFNFSINIPDNWFFRDGKQVDEFKNSVPIDDKKLKTVVKNTTSLLSVYQYDEWDSPEFNPSLEIVAMNLQSVPEFKTEMEHLANAADARIWTTENETYDFIELSRNTINGIDFHLMTTVTIAENFYLLKKCYMAIRNDLVLCFVLSSAEKEQDDIMMKSMETIKFY